MLMILGSVIDQVRYGGERRHSWLSHYTLCGVLTYSAALCVFRKKERNIVPGMDVDRVGQKAPLVG